MRNPGHGVTDTINGHIGKDQDQTHVTAAPAGSKGGPTVNSAGVTATTEKDKG